MHIAKNPTKYSTAFNESKLNTQYDLKYQSTIRKTILSIDSSKRNTLNYPNQSKYSIKLDQPYREVIGFELINIIIPHSIYNITNYNNTIYFSEKTNGDILSASIEPGNYDISDLLTEIGEVMTDASQESCEYTLYSVNNTNLINFQQSVAGSSDLFTLYFFGGQEKTVEENYINLYKPKSIGKILGFKPMDYSNDTVAATRHLFSDYPYNLNQLNYLNLYVNKNNKFKHMQSNNDATKECFCVIPLNRGSNYFIYNKTSTFTNNTYYKEFNEPIPNLGTLDIEFRDKDNNYYDFNNQDHLLIFEITQHMI